MRFICFFLLITSLVSAGALIATNQVMENTYENQVRGHLKLAASAQTVELARTELALAVHGLEARHETEGFTSMFYNTPDEDIGFWFRNLNASLAELTTLPPEATLLERSNILMRLRSTLLHHGEHGEKVNEPDGIGTHPNNMILFSLVMMSLLIATVSGLGLSFVPDKYDRRSRRRY